MSWDHMKSFALEYLKHDVLLRRISRIAEPAATNFEWVQLPGPTHAGEAGRRRRAQWLLSKALGVPNYGNFIMRRIAAFQRWLYIEVCKRVRVCLLRGKPAPSALDDAPEWVRKATNALQLLPLALRAETKSLEKEGAATAIVSMLCSEWEALCCACAGPAGCDDCRSEGLPPRAVLQATAQLMQLQDTDSLLRLWTAYRDVALNKLRALTAAGDDARRLPPPARPAPPDWRVIDLTLRHDARRRLLGTESLSHHEQLQPLIALFGVVQCHGLHPPRPPPAAAQAWRAAHRQLLTGGSSVSLVVAQRRWHEMCATARACLLSVQRRRPARPRLPPLYQAMLRRFPEIATQPLPSWSEMVAKGLVYYDTAAPPTLCLPEWPPPPAPPSPPAQDNEDDLILVEKHVETIDVEESDDETREGCGENEDGCGENKEGFGENEDGCGENKGGSGENEDAHSETKEVDKNATSIETLARNNKSLEQAIRDEIQNHREFLRNNVGAIQGDTINQQNPILENDANVNEASLLKESHSSNPIAVESVANKNVETSKISDKMTTVSNIMNIDTSSLNSLDTGQRLEILQKVNPESSEAMIIFDDDDDSDEADKPSGKQTGNIEENIDQSNKASVDLRTDEIFIAESDNEINSEYPNKDDLNKPAQSLHINKDENSASPQLVIESPQSAVEGPVLVLKEVNPTEGLNINKDVVAESLEPARENPVLAPESSNTIVSVIPTENVITNEKEIVTENPDLITVAPEPVTNVSDTEVPVILEQNVNINKGRVAESQEQVTRTDTIVPITQAENVNINKEIDAENPEQKRSPELEQASLNPATEDSGIATGPILSRQENNESPIAKDLLAERLNVNEESNTDSSDRSDSGHENGTEQNFSIINKNVLEYKTKLKEERDGNVEIGESNEYSRDLIKRSLVDLLRENLGKGLDVSEIIPKINDKHTTINLESNTESEMSSDCNSNDTKMAVDSSEADSATNMDTTDAPGVIDGKLLMTPRVLVTRIDAERQTRLRRACRPLRVRLTRLPPALLRRYLHGGRQSRSVRLPDIEEVRRAHRSLLCAQVAPTPLRPESDDADVPPAESPPSDAECDCAESIIAVEDNGQPALTETELMDLLQRCEPPAARRRKGTQYCCLARRHRAYNDARRRLAANARRAPPADIDLHGARHGRAGEECSCCCVHLVKGAADSALGRRVARRVARLDRRARRLLACPGPGQEDVLEESDTDDDDIYESAADTSKPASKKTPQCKRKSKKSSTEEDEEDSSSAPQISDGYQEWIRQKNLTTKYFHINPLGDHSKERQKEKPNAERQSKTAVATTSSENNKHDIYTVPNFHINPLGDHSKERQKEKPNAERQSKTAVATTSSDNNKRDIHTVQNKYVARVFGKVNKPINQPSKLRVFGKVHKRIHLHRYDADNKEENVKDHTKLNQEIIEDSTQVVSFTSTLGQQVIKICKPGDDQKKFGTRKRKSLGDLVENIPNKITLKIPSQFSLKALDNSRNETETSMEGPHNAVDEPVKNDVNVAPTDFSIDVIDSSSQDNKIVSANPSLTSPKLYVELNPLDSGLTVVGPVLSGNMKPLTIFNKCDNKNVPDGSMECDFNTLSEGDLNTQGEILKSIKETHHLAERNYDSDDDIVDKLFIDETIRNLERSESQGSVEAKAESMSGINEGDGQAMSENKCYSEEYKDIDTKDASPVTECDTNAVKVENTFNVVSEVNKPNDKTIQETLPDAISGANDLLTSQNSEQSDKSDEELKTLPVIKVYQKLSRPKTSSDKMILAINLYDNLSKATDTTKDKKESNKDLKTEDCAKPTASSQAGKDDSDDDIQIVESEAIKATNPRSLLRGQSADIKVYATQRPPTLLEQIAQMHQKGKKFVIKKVSEKEPILIPSSTNLNQVSQYIELVPDTKATNTQPVVNLNQQLANLCGPATPVPQVVTIKQMSPPRTVCVESKTLTIDSSQTAQVLQQNAQVLPRISRVETQNVETKSSPSTAPGLYVTIAPEGLVLTAEEVPEGAASGTSDMMPRISKVTSLAGEAPSVNTIVMKSVATQSGSANAKTRRGPGWRLSPAPPLAARRFVRNRDPTDITVLCVDSARPPLRLAEDHLVVTELELPCVAPTYWTVASDKKTRMLTFDDPGEGEGEGEAKKDAAPQPPAGGGLKVKSFARLAEANALATPPAPAAPAAPAGAPDRVHTDGKLYKKMTDDPLVYARVLHVVPDLAAVRRAIAAGAALGLRAPGGRVLRVLRAPPSAPGAPASSTGLRCDGALPALSDLVRRLNQETAESVSDVINLDSDDD